MPRKALLHQKRRKLSVHNYRCLKMFQKLSSKILHEENTCENHWVITEIYAFHYVIKQIINSQLWDVQ